MKKIHKFLGRLLRALLGVCAGSLIGKYIHYMRNPALYITYSSPWYIDNVMILLAITIIITMIAYWVIGFIVKKCEQRKIDG